MKRLTTFQSKASHVPTKRRLGRACFLLIFLIIACKKNIDKVQKLPLPPSIFTEKKDTSLHNINGTWMQHRKAYNGYVVEKENNSIMTTLPIIAGKEHGKAESWYKNGRKKYERNFIKGNREGQYQGWYENGRLAYHYFFHNDKYEGEQKSYFESGHRWQSLHYINGYEEGKQKTWNDSGRVINNFTVKNGKLYGVIGRYDCMSVIKK